MLCSLLSLWKSVAIMSFTNEIYVNKTNVPIAVSMSYAYGNSIPHTITVVKDPVYSECFSKMFNDVIIDTNVNIDNIDTDEDETKLSATSRKILAFSVSRRQMYGQNILN